MYCASKNDFSTRYSFEEHGTSEGMAHSGLRSAEQSKNNKSFFKNKIHCVTIILYLNYKNNVYKVENVNGGGGR